MINKLNDFSQLKSLKKRIVNKKVSILTEPEMALVNDFINSHKKNKLIVSRKRGKLFIKNEEIDPSCIIDVNDRVSILHLINLLKTKKVGYRFIGYRHKNAELLYDIKLVKDNDIRFKSVDLNRIGILIDKKDIHEFDGIIETDKKSILLYDGTSAEVSIQDYRYIRKMIARNLDINVSEVRIDYKLK